MAGVGVLRREQELLVGQVAGVGQLMDDDTLEGHGGPAPGRGAEDRLAPEDDAVLDQDQRPTRAVLGIERHREPERVVGRRQRVEEVLRAQPARLRRRRRCEERAPQVLDPAARHDPE